MPEQFTRLELAGFHEAGHLIAADMRLGAEGVRDVTIRQDGTGLANVRVRGCSAEDSWFVSFAGPWAEARHIWGQAPRCPGYEDEDGITFDDVLRAALLFGGDHDASLLRLRHQVLTERGMPDPDALMENMELVWDRELAGNWPAIEAVATNLIHSGTLTGAAVIRLIDAAPLGPDEWATDRCPSQPAASATTTSTSTGPAPETDPSQRR